MAESDEDVRDQGGRKYVRRHGRLQDIKEAISGNTYSPEDLEKLGAKAYQEGDYDAAAVYLQEACMARRDPTAMARFAELMEKAHEPERAFKAYEFAVNQGSRARWWCCAWFTPTHRHMSSPSPGQPVPSNIAAEVRIRVSAVGTKSISASR